MRIASVHRPGSWASWQDGRFRLDSMRVGYIGNMGERGKPDAGRGRCRNRKRDPPNRCLIWQVGRQARGRKLSQPFLLLNDGTMEQCEAKVLWLIDLPTVPILKLIGTMEQ